MQWVALHRQGNSLVVSTGLETWHAASRLKLCTSDNCDHMHQVLLESVCVAYVMMTHCLQWPHKCMVCDLKCPRIPTLSNPSHVLVLLTCLSKFHRIKDTHLWVLVQVACIGYVAAPWFLHKRQYLIHFQTISMSQAVFLSYTGVFNDMFWSYPILFGTCVSFRIIVGPLFSNGCLVLFGSRKCGHQQTWLMLFQAGCQ